MSLKEEVFKKPITELGLSTLTQSNLFHRVKGYYSSEPAWSNVSVKDVIVSLGSYVSGVHPSSSEREFFRKLEELGLTRLDCVFIRQSTVSVEALKRLSRKELLAQPARVLGVSNKLLEELWWVLLNERGTLIRRDPTIKDLLKFNLASSTSEMSLYNRFEGSIRNARELLKEAIDINDWKYYRFLVFGSQDDYVERLSSKYKKSRQEMEELTRIAALEGWIKVI